MFTGLIEEVGTVRALTARPHGADAATADSGLLAIDCTMVVEDAHIGDSIAVNGACLTVTALPDAGGFEAEMMGETLSRTALGALQPGAPVNLERSVRAGDRLGGHMVQGHVDGVGAVRSIEVFPDWTMVTYDLPVELAPFVAEKGSITIDGTSLTVTSVGPDSFSVGLIPHTLAVTTHGHRAVGDPVNLEVDVIARYVQRQLEARAQAPQAQAPPSATPQTPSPASQQGPTS